MRLSTRLIRNASTTYMRLGTTFLLGLFMTWYTIGHVGLVGFGMIGLAIGTLGMSAIDAAIRQSVVRELAAALASEKAERVQRVLVSGLAFCACAGTGLFAFYGLLAWAAGAGLFRAPPELAIVLAWLFLAEGAAMGPRLVLAPYTQALFASQRVGVDNALAVVDRLVNVTAAILAFSVLAANGSVVEKLTTYAVLRAALSAGELLIEIAVARRLVPTLRFRRDAFDRAEFKAVAGTVWHTGQMTLLAAAGPKFIMVLINLMFGLAFNGIWTLVIQVGGHLSMIANGLLRGIDPLTTHLQAQGRRDAILHLMVQGVRYQLLAVLPLAAVYAMYLSPILTVWVGGRFDADEGLAAAGIAAAAAIHLAAIMASVNLLAQVFRMSSAGMERMLFGMGEVRSYAWFAKLHAVVAVGGAALCMWLAGTPVVAPIPLAVANFVFYLLVIPAAAVRRAGFPLHEAVRRSVPRPLVVTLLVAGPLWALRPVFGELTIVSLLALAGVFAVLVLPLGWWIGLEREERARLVQLTRRVLPSR